MRKACACPLACRGVQKTVRCAVSVAAAQKTTRNVRAWRALGVAAVDQLRQWALVALMRQPPLVGVWPEAVFGSDRRPCPTTSCHASLRREAVSVVSLPPHRRWHLPEVPGLRASRFFGSSISAWRTHSLDFFLRRYPATARNLQKTEPHARGYDEDGCAWQTWSGVHDHDSWLL